MIQKIIQVLIVTAFLSTSYHSAFGSDDDENFYFANGNNKFFFYSRKNCQPNYYFDVDLFKCRLCDGVSHLMTNELSKFMAMSYFGSFWLIMMIKIMEKGWTR